MRGFIQHLGKISAALLLNHDRRGDNSEFLNGDSCDHVFHSGFHFETIILFFEASPEFNSDRVGALAAYQAHRGNQTVPRPNRADHQVESFGQPLQKQVETLAALELYPPKRGSTGNRAETQSEGERI